VNQVRNRFTSIDIDATFCPTPKYKVLHMFDTLFTAGPCLLGSAINRVLGRHGQEILEPGEIAPASKVDVWASRGPIPGRIVILKQNKSDEAADHFIDVEKNLVVAATSIPDSDDRWNSENGSSTEEAKGGEHYSKAHAIMEIYGIKDGLYTDLNAVREDIRVIVDVPRAVAREKRAATSEVLTEQS